MEKMFTLKPGRLPQADVRNIIFFVRPRLELMDIITDNVRRYGRAGGRLRRALRAVAERPGGPGNKVLKYLEVEGYECRSPELSALTACAVSAVCAAESLL